MRGPQRCFGIVVFGTYPVEAVSDNQVEGLDDDRDGALREVAERFGAAHLYVDQFGLAEWLAELIEKGASE